MNKDKKDSIDLTKPTKKKPIELDRLAYNVYKKSSGGISINGQTLPPYDNIPENVKKCWQDVVSALSNPKEYISKIINN